MRHRLQLSVFLVVIFCRAAVAAPQQDASSVVRSFYRWYLSDHKHGVDNLSPFKSSFTHDFYDALARAAKKQAGGEEFLDFDPFVNAQEYAQSASVGVARVSGNTARVDVQIVFGPNAKHTQTVVLRREAGSWRMADIDYGKGSMLSSTLAKINRSR